MKKRFLASLLALGMLLSLTAGTALAAETDEAGDENSSDTTAAVAKIGEKSYSDFANAIKEAEQGTITLLKDVSVTGTDNSWNNVNIDMAGHSVQVEAGAKLTISGGEFTSNGFNLLVIQGAVDINGAKFKSTVKTALNKEADSKSVIIVEKNGTLTMPSGEIDASQTGDGQDCGMYALSLFYGAEVTLGTENSSNGPTLKGAFSAIAMNHDQATPKNKLTIHSGTYSIAETIASEKFNAVLYLPANADVKITGGEFTAPTTAAKGPYIFSVPYSDSAVQLTVSGGTFTSSSTIFRTENQSSPGGGTSSGQSVTITGGTFTEKKSGDAFSFDRYIPAENNSVVKNDSTPVVITKLTVTAKRTEDNQVTLSVTEAVESGSTRHYQTYTSEPSKPGDAAFVSAGWKNFPGGAFDVQDNETYVAVVDVKDNKIMKWGMAPIPAKQQPVTPPAPEPAKLSLAAANGGIGKKITVSSVTKGHWLTIQAEHGNSVTISSVEATGSAATVNVSFYVKTGSKVTVWESENELTFTNGVPAAGQILARGETQL